MIKLEHVKEVLRQAEEAEAYAEKICREYAKQECPLKEGDITDCIGYSHRGKKMIVDGVGFCHLYSGEIGWRVVGRVLKSDGTPGKNSAGFTQYQWEKEST